MRWNNKVTKSGTWDLWTPGGYSFAVTQGVLIGYKGNGTLKIVDAYFESLGNHVAPQSLYLAQLLRRDNVTAWILELEYTYREFFNSIFNPNSNRHPVFNSGLDETITVLENMDAGKKLGNPFLATDINTTDTLTYRLMTEVLFSNDSDLFSIDSSTGQLKTKSLLDYESQISYRVIIRVEDGNGGWDVHSVTVNLIDEVNEFVPVNERTLEVQNAIIASLAPQSLGRRPTAEEVTAEHLADVVFLTIAPSLTELDKDDFRGLTGLEKLEIQGVGPDETVLTKLPKGIFKDLRSLKYLRLDFNGIKRLPAGVFEGMAHLDELRLNNNQLKNLTNDPFKDLLQLRILRLNENQITSINRDTFRNQTNLEKLYLFDNNLKRLPQNLLFNLTSLVRLNLNSNQLSEIPIGFFDHSIGGTAVLGNLQTLTLSGNKVDPLVITISAKKKGQDKFVIKVDSGAPFDFDLPIVVNNGSIVDDPSHILIKQGFGKSVDYTVVRGNNISAPTTIDIGELPSIPALHHGYIVKKSADLPLQILESVLRPIGGAPAIPTRNALLENFPNPFNPETWVPYQLSEKSRVRLTIYSLRGIIVRDINLGIQAAGFYTARSKAAYWDGKNEFGEGVSSGIYFYQLRANNFSAIRKMSILK